jgi:hypothetical protein
VFAGRRSSAAASDPVSRASEDTTVTTAEISADDLAASGPADPAAMLPFIDEDDPLAGESVRADPDGTLSVLDPETNDPVRVSGPTDAAVDDEIDEDAEISADVPAGQDQVFDRSENRETKMRVRGPEMAQEQGREGRIDQLETTEFDPNLPAHVRGWMKHERRLVGQGRLENPRTPPGFVLAHGRVTPAREGYDYSNSRLQNTDLNQMEERVRRRAQAAQRTQRRRTAPRRRRR